MLLTRRCPVCLEPSRSVCRPCWAARADPPVVTVPHTDETRALCSYDRTSKLVILAAKNHHRRDLLIFLGQQLASLVVNVPLVSNGGVARSQLLQDHGDRQFQRITWVPASVEQRRVRGFDQGEVLAKGLARALRIPAVGLLARESGAKQVGKNRTERLSGPGLRPTRKKIPASVLLVDDVLTTGGSLRAAALTLRGGGAASVAALVVAAKP